MYKLTIMAVAVALLSGCGGYPRYSVVKGSPSSFLSDSQEKRHVDPALVENTSGWHGGWATPQTGECQIRREDKDKISSIWNPPEHPILMSKLDVNCVVWDATDTRPHRYGPF